MMILTPASTRSFVTVWAAEAGVVVVWPLLRRELPEPLTFGAGRGTGPRREDLAFHL